MALCEVIFLDFAYPKRDFASDSDKIYFEEYMSEFSGKLTAEKEEKILAEQERILGAYNEEQMIMRKLSAGEFSTEAEFKAEIEKTSAVTERKAAFDSFLEEYEYAAEDPEKRYILSGNYDGFAADYPDVFILVFTILMTAALFLNEESSNVITFIRIYENGGAKTLSAKLLTLFFAIFALCLFRTGAEFLFMSIRGNFSELLYPLQSVEFFGTSEYNISILGAFFAVSAARLTGYLFVSALIILLSVTVKKALFTVFIPCAVCVLQQFVFTPATPAYYLPTGLLRGVGYFRGSDPESSSEISALAPEAQRFIAVPAEYFALIMILTIIFIIFSIIIAARYYGGVSRKRHKKAAALVLTLTVLVSLSGCSPQNENEKIIFNSGESTWFAQNDDFYFISDERGAARISKSDGEEVQLFHDPFYSGDYDISMTVCGGELYCYNKAADGSGGLSVDKITLNGLRKSTVSTAQDDGAGFLGLSLKSDNDFVGTVYSIFTDGSEIYFICADRKIYSLNGGAPECVVSEGLYDVNQVSFDGREIYYINKKLELKRYDVGSGETAHIAGDFTKTIYYDGTRLIFSNDEGIFSFVPDDNSTEKLSSERAEAISSDGKSIIYSKDGALFLLCDGEDAKFAENASNSYAVISGINKVLIAEELSGNSFKAVDLPIK